MNLYRRKSEKGISSLFFKKKLHDLKSIQLLNPQKKERILEIGCNSGELVRVIRNYSNSVIGIDVNQAVIKNSSVKGLKVMSAEKLKFKDSSFDKVISVHTLEHVPNLKKALSEIERVLKKEGLCVLIYPFEIFRGSGCLFNALFMYGSPLKAWQLHLHKITPQKISQLSNLTIIQKGIFWGPFPTYYTVLKKTKTHLFLEKLIKMRSFPLSANEFL